MKLYRVSRQEGYTGRFYAVEYSLNKGYRWVTVSTHNTAEETQEEMLYRIEGEANSGLFRQSLCIK